MKIQPFIVSFFFAFFLFTVSCKKSKKANLLNYNDNAISFSVDSIVNKGKLTFFEGDSNNSIVRLEIPKFSKLGDLEKIIADSVAQRQYRGLVDAIFLEDGQVPPSNIPQAIDMFLKSSDIDPKDKTARFVPYAFESDVDTVFVGNEVISIAIHDHLFTGGAHPNSYTEYLNFDRKNRKYIDPSSLVKDTVAFKKVVEAAFIDNEKNELGTDFDIKNYFFEEKFMTPNNLAITKNGLLCRYNPYEAAAYVRGPIEFTIPWRNLNNIITQYVPLDDVKLGDDLQ